MSNNSQVQSSVILRLANSILEALQQDIVIDEEDYLFNDEFYITIVSNIVPENTCNIPVGETEEEKAESLTQLVNFLETIVEMNLNHINAQAIIWERDETSVKDLLELILELIIILKQEQEEGSVRPSHRGSQNNSDNQTQSTENKIEEAKESERPSERPSENNSERPVEESADFEFIGNKSCPEVDFDPGNSDSQIQYKENYSQNDLTRYEKVMAYLASNEEFLQGEEGNQMAQMENINQNHLMDPQYDMNFCDDSKPTVNISRISEVSRSKENSEPHSHQKYLRQHTNNSKNLKNDSESMTVKQTNSNNKLIPDSYGGDSHQVEDEDYILDQNTESVQLDMNMDVKRDTHTQEEEIEDENEIENESNYSEFEGNNIPIRQIDEPIIPKPNKSGNSQNTHMTQSEREKSAKSLQSHLTSNKNSKSKGNSNISNQNKSGNRNESQVKKASVKGSQGSQNSQQIDQFESSNFEMGIDNSDRVLKKTKSQKQLINHSRPRSQNNRTNNKSQISASSVNQSHSRRTEDAGDLTENIIDELPLNEENLKFEIMKEFRKLYGNKLDRVLLNNNFKNSSSTLEMILRNVRLAKQKMVKLGMPQSDCDDLVTKEFMIKYSKELEYIINYYQNEEKRRNFFKQKAVSTMSKNMKLIQKINEIENKNIENEIERRRKSREVRNKHNQIKICNEIYSKALELEKQKYLEERAIQAEMRRNENNEKRMIMTQIENYYKDKISILKEILRREKYEKELEHRAKIQYISKFEREKKQNYKKQIDEIFNRLDEEDRKQDFLNSNSDQMEKILMTYYKK